MQTSIEPASIAGNASERGPLTAETSFAELLASMAAPPKPETGWNDTELAEDVATISYEQALRTHGRSRGSDAEPDRHPTSLGSACAPVASSPAHGHESAAASAAKPPKTASITIRLSETECAQLRLRAAEAGLTVSAYLRSCTLEVESLRAQVKQTLAQLRAPKPPAPEANRQPNGTGGLRGILARLWHWFQQLGPSRRPDFRLNPGNPFAPVR
jgi:hypothetical protein